MLTLVGTVVKEGDRIAQLVLERVSACFLVFFVLGK